MSADREDNFGIAPPSAVAQPGRATPAVQSRSAAVWAATGSGMDGKVSNGGLTAAYCCAGAYSTVLANQGVTRGRHYWELTLATRAGEPYADTWTSAGLRSIPAAARAGGSPRLAHYGSDPKSLSVEVGRDRSIRDGDVLMFALDADSGQAYWGLNGQWRNGTPGQTSGQRLQIDAGEQWVAFVSISASSNRQSPEGDRWTANFGGQRFRHGPPPGYDSYGNTAGSTATIVTTPRAASPDSPIGRIVEGVVNVGGQAIPLPEGAWVTLAQFKGTAAQPGDAMVLGQVHGGALRRLLAVRGLRVSAGVHANPVPKACQRSDILFREADDGAGAAPHRCWWVNHATGLWSQQSIFAAAQLELDQRKVSRPDVLINVGFHRADEHGFATGFYYFDPNEESISSSPGPWAASEWHKDRIASDPRRAAYVQKLIDWGRGWAPVYYATR